MNKNTNAQLYYLDYAEKYSNSIIHKDYNSINRLMYYKDDHLHSMQGVTHSLWNKLRVAQYIQENELNNTNQNYLTSLKILIESRNHIFKTDFKPKHEYQDKHETQEKPKEIIKNNVGRIMKTRHVNDKDYYEITTKENKDITAIDNLMMKKVQMIHELAFDENINERILNECLKIYSVIKIQ